MEEKRREEKRRKDRGGKAGVARDQRQLLSRNRIFVKI
jgi:hypothetical protein